MTLSAESLRTLHRIHQQLRDLRERLETGPKQVRAHEANVARVTQQLEKVEEDARAARMAADQKELLLKTNEQKIKDLKTKLNTCSTNREYQALKDQIAADEMACSVLADEILEAMEKADNIKAQVPEATAELTKARDEVERTRATVAENQARLQADIAGLEQELKDAECAMPADARDAYERVVRSRGSEGLAPVDSNTCSACHHQIQPNTLSMLLMSHVSFCKSCGALLYLPENY